MKSATMAENGVHPADASSGGTGTVPTSDARGNTIRVVLLLLLTFVAYQPVWHAGFIWDDDTMLTANRAVQAPDGLRTIWLSTELPDYFPVTSTAFWLQWRLWGPDPLGYHLVNVLLHALAAVLWWRVLRRLAVPGAWLAAAIFAVHPVNVESVAWISELKNTLAMTLFTAAILAYLRFDDAGAKGAPAGRWYVTALVAFLGSMLSKTATAAFPVVLLAFAWWRHGRVTWRDFWRSVPFFAISALLAAVTVWFQYVRAIGSTVVRTDDFWGRLAGAGWAIWFYLSKAILPVNLQIVYPRWQIDPQHWLSYVPGVLAVVAAWTCWHYRERWGRQWLFALVFFVAMLLPILGFFNIGAMRYSLVADRWQYFALMAPITVAAAGLAMIGRRLGRQARLLPVAAASILVCGLALLSWRQTQVYRDPGTLWQATLERNPECSIAHNEVGNELFNRGEIDAAIGHFRRALEILPNYEIAYYNYGCALLEQGDIAGALHQFERAVASEPDLFNARYNLGTTLLNAGRTDDAMPHLQRAVELEPQTAKARNNFAAALLDKGQYDAALMQYEAALTLDPEHAGAWNNVGWILLQLGRVDEAIAAAERAVALQPSDATARNNLGEAWAEKGDLPTALAQFEQAVAFRGDDARFRANLGRALLQSGRPADAIAHLRAALAATPGEPELHNDLANALLQSGDVGAAETQYVQALERAPRHAKASNNLGWLLFQTGRRDEALAHLRRAVDVEPDYANARRNLGDALLAAGRVEEAIDHFKRAIVLRADDEAAHLSLGAALLANAQPTEARAAFDHALELQPENPDVLVKCAWAYASSRDPQFRHGARAIELAKRALARIGGDHPVGLRVLAAAYAANAQLQDALVTARAALQIAEAARNETVVDQLRTDLRGYESGRPLHDQELPAVH